MVDDKELIPIRWHVDRTVEPAMFMLICTDPAHQDLTVSISSADVTERSAKAKLMQAMYDLGREKGIAPRLLRFTINGIEE